MMMQNPFNGIESDMLSYDYVEIVEDRIRSMELKDV
jgi:hypothetical protein